VNFLVDWKAGFAVMVNGRLRSQAISAKTRGCARQRVVTIGKWTAVNALGGGLQRSKSAIEIGLEVFDILHADMEPLPSVSSGQAFAFAEIVPNMKSEWPPIYLVAARACVYRYPRRYAAAATGSRKHRWAARRGRLS
jgi:hypothetical protein